MKKMTALLALLLAAAFSLVACGGNNDTGSGSASGTASTQFNNADVQFAQEMIPHHQQAVQMAKMAQSHAASPQVKQLASDIEAAQGPEIATMTQWLKAWGKDVPSDSSSDSMGGMDMGDGSSMSSGDMPGMMSADDMHQLDMAHGAEWDKMFLTMMVQHHQGAIEMAKTEQASGLNPDAIALAKKIEKAQTAEIAQMQGMLAS